MAQEGFRICKTEELAPGERKIVTLKKRSIGVFNINGEYFALKNTCPHQRAPLCEGKITGTTLPSKVGEYHYGHEGEIIHCPWHQWEFNIKTGKSVFNPHRVRVATYPVEVESKETTSCASSCEQDPSVETFPVEVEANYVVVYI